MLRFALPAGEPLLGLMHWRPKAEVLEWLVPLSVGVGLCALVPLGAALQFGTDEGYELMKALLVSLGHPLYREVWNDQPPLHTELLALLFRIFGPSAYAGRLLSVGFAMVLVWSLYKLVSARSGRLAGLLAVALLASSGFFLQLSVSVMLELPAIALALAAAWAWTRYVGGNGRWWLKCSGLLFGCALQVKLTAAIVLPALAADFLFNRPSGNRETDLSAEPGRWTRSHEALLWCSTALAAFGLILAAFYCRDTLPVFWASHFSTGTSNAVASEGYAFRPESILDDMALAVPAVAGLLLLGCKCRRDLLLPTALLAAALAIHLWHRPYWHYYGLHFAIPLAWLGGVGIVEWFRLLWNQETRIPLLAKLGLAFRYLAWSLVVSLVITLAPENLWNEVLRLKAARLAEEEGTVAALRQRAEGTPWVFTDQTVAAFWAGLPVPPELAVIPSKRIWSGQISRAAILESLERYQPRLVLLRPGSEVKFGLTDYLRQHYQPDPASGAEGLYLRK